MVGSPFPSIFPQDQLRGPRVEPQLQTEDLGVLGVHPADHGPQLCAAVIAVDHLHPVHAPPRPPQAAVNSRLGLLAVHAVEVQMERSALHRHGGTTRAA